MAKYTRGKHVYILNSQGAQNYEAHNVLLILLLGADFRVPEKLIFPALVTG